MAKNDDKMQRLINDLEELALKIKHYEDNLKFLKAEKANLDGSILDMQVALGKYPSASVAVVKKEVSRQTRNEEETVECILRHQNSAAGILYHLKTHCEKALDIEVAKDVVGIVATLAKVDDDNLNRILSEYLGLETMLAVVCKTYDGVRALETYDKGGLINRSLGLHGLGGFIERPLDGRFRVICLEHLRPYTGQIIDDDPQKRLDLLKPRLPSGELPPGFIGYAVNNIIIDSSNLSRITTGGYGLRETLFYNLFPRLQIYQTRTDMLQALPCISDGAVSLDGGMIRNRGLFSLGYREDIDVKFPKGSGKSNLPEHCLEIENRMKEKKWKRDRVLEDVKRELELLDQAKFNFQIKKEDFVRFLAEGSPLATLVTPTNSASLRQDRIN